MNLRARWTRIDGALTAPGPAFRLAEVQVLLALVVGWRLATRDWTVLADRPAVLTDGLTIMSWLPGPLPAPAAVALQVIGLVGVALVVVRRRPRIGLVLAWCAYAALCALWSSSGKVMHNDVLTVTVVFVMLFADAPLPHQTTTRSVRWGWPPRAALAVVATVYFLTGVQKLRHSGLDWVFSENMTWILRQGSSPHAGAISDMVADRPWLSQTLAGGALLLELTAPLWLAVRGTRILFVAAVFTMHTSIWLFLGIDYSAWVLTVAAVAVPMALRPERPLIRPRWGPRQPAAGLARGYDEEPRASARAR